MIDLSHRYAAAARKCALVFAGPGDPSAADWDAATEYVDSLVSPWAGATHVIWRWDRISECARLCRDERLRAERVERNTYLEAAE